MEGVGIMISFSYGGVPLGDRADSAVSNRAQICTEEHVAEPRRRLEQVPSQTASKCPPSFPPEEVEESGSELLVEERECVIRSVSPGCTEINQIMWMIF